MSNSLRKTLHGFGWKLLYGIREKVNERISDAEFEEKIIGIEKATIAMIEAGVKEETIIAMLQKHWNLRLSEAKSFIEDAKALVF